MAELTAKLFMDYFGGSWAGKIFRNGDLIREIVVTGSAVCGKHSNPSSNALWIVPPRDGLLNGSNQVAIAGWHSDIRGWCDRWYNEFGGYGELSWTSQGVVNGVRVLYGTVHECEKQGDDPADYIAMCELYDQDNFKYTIQSYRKGILEIVASRVKTSRELSETGNTQVDASRLIKELSALTKERSKPIEQKRSAKTAGSTDR